MADLFDSEVGDELLVQIGDAPARRMRVVGKDEPREVEDGIVETSVRLVEVMDHDGQAAGQDGHRDQSGRQAAVGRRGPDQAGSGCGPGCPDGLADGETPHVVAGHGVSVSPPALRSPGTFFTVDGTTHDFTDMYDDVEAAPDSLWARGFGGSGGLRPPPPVPPMPTITSEQLAEFAKSLEIELLPWQLDLFKRFMASGVPPHISYPGRGRP